MEKTGQKGVDGKEGGAEEKEGGKTENKEEEEAVLEELEDVDDETHLIEIDVHREGTEKPLLDIFILSREAEESLDDVIGASP